MYTSEDKVDLGTSVEYEIVDGHHLETLRNKTIKTKTSETMEKDELDDYWEGTVCQRRAQDREMEKLHAEAFSQPGETTAVEW